MALIFRDNKGSALSFSEMDSNFRHFTGSFTNTGTITAAAFAGDGSAITGVTAEWDGSHNGNANITGSLTVTSNISSSGGSLYGVNLDISGHALIGESSLRLREKPGIPASGILQSDAPLATAQYFTATNITASGNISASGTIFSSTHAFDAGQDSTISGDTSTITIATGTATVISSKFNNAGIISIGYVSGSSLISNTHITSSGNISASGTITGNVGTFTTLTNVNTTNVTASGNISASGNLYGTGLTTSGSRVKTFRQISVGSMSTNPSDEIFLTDELVLITNNNSSAGGVGEGNLSITSWLNNSDLGAMVELSIFQGTGTVSVILKYEAMDQLNINGTDASNNNFSLVNMDGVNDVGAFVKILKLGNNSASIWGTGIYK